VQFLQPARRKEAIARIANWRPPRYQARVSIEYQFKDISEMNVVRTFGALARELMILPFQFILVHLSKAFVHFERPIDTVTAFLASFLERHYIIYNFISNPLIDLGILFELLLCYLFFYTPLANIYHFAPVPWHVYLFAFHGTALLFAFEETKKYYRRKGYELEILG